MAEKTKPCPKCGESILDRYKEHFKCGWKGEAEAPEEKIKDKKEKQKVPGIANGILKQKGKLLLECRDFVLKHFDIKEFPDRHTLVNSLFISINKEANGR